MNQNEAEEYTQGLEQSLSGGYRLYAWAQRNGVPRALGLSTEEWIRRVGGYVKMLPADRREAVAELKDEGHSNVEIGKLLGVAEGTVRNDLASQNCEDDRENERNFNGNNNPPSQDYEDDAEDSLDEMSPVEISRSAKMAFLLRANEAKNFAFYPPDQRADREAIKEAELTRDAWGHLVSNMKARS